METSSLDFRNAILKRLFLQTAVKTLSRADDLDNVPALIHALTDGDRRVAHEANQGLRFISRKLLAYPLPSEPTIEQKWAVQSQWKNWLLSIRPDAEFMD